MSIRWNLSELRQYIRDNATDEKSMLDVVRSIDRSLAIFNYHVVTARDALNDFTEGHDSSSIEMAKYVFGIHENREDMDLANIISEAHIISSINTLRSIYDIFSHLVNGLLLSSKFDVSRCDIYKVRSELSNSQLKNQLDQILDGYWFKYIAGFINTAKHRNLVTHSFTVSLEDDKVGAKIASFSYAGVQYNSYWVNEVLEGIVNVKNDLIQIGKLLNDQLPITAA